MRIELERLVYPEAAEEVECALCERPFTLGLVIARALRSDGVDDGMVCPECATWMGRGPMARSWKFRTTEEDYERKAAEWRTPEHASADEYEAVMWEQFKRRERERSKSR
jgi:hypothetical protein